MVWLRSTFLLQMFSKNCVILEKMYSCLEKSEFMNGLKIFVYCEVCFIC